MVPLSGQSFIIVLICSNPYTLCGLPCTKQSTPLNSSFASLVSKFDVVVVIIVDAPSSSQIYQRRLNSYLIQAAFCMAKQNKETHKRADQTNQFANKIKSQLARCRFISLPRFLDPPKILMQLCLNTNLMLFFFFQLILPLKRSTPNRSHASCIHNKC